MAENWDALVWGDYEAVMPLPWKKKWGIKYVYTPMFLQRLGLFGNNIPASLVQECYRQAARHFALVDLMTGTPAGDPGWKTTPRQNLVIPLNQPYEAISSQYSAECGKNIRKAVNRRCQFAENISIEHILSLYWQVYGGYSPHTTEEIMKRLEAWAKESARQGNLLACGVTDATDQSILFGALVFRCNKRLYYLAGAPTEKGRKARATYFFIDQLLQKWAGQPLLFDFEGSDIPAVADFYNRFGPRTETYYHLLYNGLPWWVRLFRSPSPVLPGSFQRSAHQ